MNRIRSAETVQSSLYSEHRQGRTQTLLAIRPSQRQIHAVLNLSQELTATAGLSMGAIYGSTYYTIVGGDSWSASEILSQNQGGHLVCINSQEENKWIYDNFGKYAPFTNSLGLRIGLTDKQEEVVFEWTSGEKGEETLAKAFQLQQRQHCKTPTVTKSVDDEDSGWQAVIDDFIKRRRQNNRARTMKDLTRHMERVMKTLAKKPRPQSGAERCAEHRGERSRWQRREGLGLAMMRPIYLMIVSIVNELWLFLVLSSTHRIFTTKFFPWKKLQAYTYQRLAIVTGEALLTLEEALTPASAVDSHS